MGRATWLCCKPLRTRVCINSVELNRTSWAGDTQGGVDSASRSGWYLHLFEMPRFRDLRVMINFWGNASCAAEGGCYGGHSAKPESECLFPNSCRSLNMLLRDEKSRLKRGWHRFFIMSLYVFFMYLLLARSVVYVPNPWPSNTPNTQCSWARYYIYFSLKIQKKKK